jgi:uncharacterized membrane protein YphA (DoxX/SURF4 family)
MFQDASWIDAAGRLAMVGFFLVAGLCNLTRQRIKDHIELGIVLQFAGCALLLAGWHGELGVWCLIVFTVAATAIFHRFWLQPDPMRRNIGRIMLLNNVGILGGLLLLLQNVR